jgi:cell division GTPase FtsZ
MKSQTTKKALSRSSTRGGTPTGRATATSAKRGWVTPTGEFDFNAWLLPTLELERYEPNIQEEVGVEDKAKGSTRFAWMGSGQCGGRLVKSFYDLGYRKVIAVNTTHHDLDLLELPKPQKFLMDIGEKGAGKDMERGRAATEQYKQEILHLARQTFGTQVDHIMICFGAGGGTGSGSAVGLIEVAKRYARYIGLDNPEKRVGVVMTLPTVGEAGSPTIAQNAHSIASLLSQLASQGKISPLVIIDNEKVSGLYPGMTVKAFWPSINSTVAGLFDIFNRLSSLSSQYTSFDPVDYRSILEAGGCTIMGLTRVERFGDRFAISEAVKKNLEKTLLADGFDLSSAKVAGCIIVGGKSLMASVKGLQDNINYAFDVLSEITGKATIHRGIYEDHKDSLRVYTIIGGLSAPAKRLEELTSWTTVQVR